MHVVSQVTDGAAVPRDVPARPVPAGPSPSVPIEGSSPSVPVEGPSPSTTSSRRPRDDAEVTINARSSVPPPELHEDDEVSEPDREPQKFYNHSRKIAALTQPGEAWFQDVFTTSGLRDLCQVGFQTIHNGMLKTFAERWHLETSSFHLPHGEITITLDDIAGLLHISIRGILLSHGRLTKEGAREILTGDLGVVPEDALEEVERTREAHVIFHFLRRQYDVELLATHDVVGDDDEEDIYKQRALRCYFLYLLDTQLFVDTSSSYTDVVYLTYLSDTACV
ncbi:protein MAIN-LIKE 1-like [Vicia villosa]|uniref:protein MAIN-LIKE 1-like n=1 Tax=Vicia villosa TaxID=3911 RepID=UPI00273BC4DA|nr:protein MAIN-LIKE 1-like [Vicia villosa]